MLHKLLVVITIAANVAIGAPPPGERDVQIIIEGDPLPAVVAQAQDRLAETRLAINDNSYVAALEWRHTANTSLDEQRPGEVTLTWLDHPVVTRGTVRFVRRSPDQFVEIRYHERADRPEARDAIYQVKNGRITHYAPAENSATMDDLEGPAQLSTIPSGALVVRNLFDHHLNDNWWQSYAPYGLESLAPKGVVKISRTVETVVTEAGRNVVRVTERFAPENLSVRGRPLSVERQIEYDPEARGVPVSIVESSHGRRKLAFEIKWANVASRGKTITFPLQIRLFRYSSADPTAPHDSAFLAVDAQTLKFGDDVDRAGLELKIPQDARVFDMATVTRKQSRHSTTSGSATPLVAALLVAGMVPLVHLLRSRARS